MVLSDLSDHRVPQSFAPSPASTLRAVLGDFSVGFPYPQVVLSIDRFSVEQYHALFEPPLEP